MRDEKGVYRFPDGEPVTNIQPVRSDGGSAFIVIISATLIAATLLLAAAMRSCS